MRLLGLLPKVGEKTAREDLGSARAAVRRRRTRRSARRLRELLPAAARAAWDDDRADRRGLRRGELSDDPGEVIYRFVKAFYDEYAVETFENYDRRMEDIDAADRLHHAVRIRRGVPERDGAADQPRRRGRTTPTRRQADRSA